MTHFTRHVLIPSVAPLMMLAIAVTPVGVLGCRTRGLVALSVTLMSGLSALGTVMQGAKARIQGRAESAWWLATTFVLTLPVVALLLLA